VGAAHKQTGLQYRVTTAALVIATLLIESNQVRAETALAAPGLPAVLVGTWQGNLKDLLGTFAFTLHLDQEGSYATQHVLLGGYTVRVRGRWTAQFPLGSSELPGPPRYDHFGGRPIRA